VKLLKHLFFIFLFTSSIVTSEELPKYRMVDLGLFGTDNSEAIAINEKGQVLGICEEGCSRFLFLWDDVGGLKLIDYPFGWKAELNNYGQIAAVSRLDGLYRLFLWDVNSGFWELEVSTDIIQITGFNDRGEILGKVENQLFLWDHGRKTNLTALFHEQVPGRWQDFEPVSLNNRGHVAFNTYKSKVTEHDTYGARSFIWKDGIFKMILSEKSWETSTRVQCIDDFENIIVNLYPSGGGAFSQFFISPSKNILVPCQGCDLIRNGFPIARDCLPGKLKKNSQEKSYFSRGVQIKKLFNENFPYYNIPNSTEVHDQNSRGYVVGQIDTMFSGRHAFLAIPEKQNEKK